MERRIGRSSARARASASSPQAYQSTGLWACWSRYGLVSSIRRFGMLALPLYSDCWLLVRYTPGEMSATPPTTVPIFIELDRDNRRLFVRWADQHESPFDWEYLRWRCPCAECSGEG